MNESPRQQTDEQFVGKLVSCEFPQNKLPESRRYLMDARTTKEVVCFCTCTKCLSLSCCSLCSMCINYPFSYRCLNLHGKQYILQCFEVNSFRREVAILSCRRNCVVSGMILVMLGAHFDLLPFHLCERSLKKTIQVYWVCFKNLKINVYS